MVQYNYPTTILLGQGSLEEFSKRLKSIGHKKVLIVTDTTVEKLGLAARVTSLLDSVKIPYALFTDTHPNPIEDDVEKGVEAYKKNRCDSIIAIGGGSPMDVAKVIKIMATHPAPLAQYDDALGGDSLIINPMPPVYAIPTTSGTGSEVGRSGVIILRETGHKHIFFHPDCMPRIAVLEPDMTAGMPPWLTAATGLDAFVHCLEAYLAPMFHPMADGIALQGMELAVRWLPAACKNGNDLDAREKMQIAAAMGAAAFQKGLGMVHSMAHPLSSDYDIHHGLANALLLPDSVAFMEKALLSPEQKGRLERVQGLFSRSEFSGKSLSDSCRLFCNGVGIEMGLSKNRVPEADLEKLSHEAFRDPCHSCNLIPVTRDDLLSVYRASL